MSLPNNDFNAPFERFQSWLEEAKESEINDPNAMSLATVSADGMPSVRMVLLKGMDPRGFVFYTNYGSRKATELLATHKAGLLFHWKSLRRQVRITGLVEKVDGAEADHYYATRGRKSRLGAWASHQSQVLENRQDLMDRLAEFEAKYPGDDIPRPPFWSGFRVVPNEIEFWYDGEARLHHREVYTRDDSNSTEPWSIKVLNP